MTSFPYAERDSIRSSIKLLADQRDDLERMLIKKITPDQQLITNLETVFGTDNPEALLNALKRTHNQMEKIYLERLRSIAHYDLTAYIEFMNPAEPPPPHIIWLAEHLMLVEAREMMRMLVSMPPGHAKSVTCSRAFPSWYLGRHPEHKYLQGGHTQGFCENEFGKPTRALVDSDNFRAVFPEVKLAKDTKAAGTWGLLKHPGRYYTKGVGVGISGFRANIGGIDDPFASREDAESQTIRNKVYDWFSADFSTRLLPNSPLFIVATRWHSDDLCGRVEQMSKDGKGIPWEVINLPAICEDDQNDPLNRALGEPLWPTFYTEEHLMNLRATLPPRDWNSLYMGKPVDAEGGVISMAWFQRYLHLPDTSKRRRVTISVDTANKDNERADFTAIGVWIEDDGGKHYLAHVVRERLEFNDMVKKIETVAKAWNANLIIIEDKGSGTQYIQTRGQGEAPCPVVPVNTGTNSKQFRMDGVAPMIEGGLVYLPQRADWLPAYESEMIGFPTASHDDQVDMTSQYLDYTRQRKGGSTQKTTGMTNTHGSKKTEAQRMRVLKDIETHMSEIEKRSEEDPIAKALRAAQEAAEAVA